ncbi:hypothetical protein B0H10DRAFT_1964508 [Mycena sp. CBHHK59/15]|nr:hypothetical protein B0H10DRAFT_1964508 [Mycena sp. CBHHK59/15]
MPLSSSPSPCRGNSRDTGRRGGRRWPASGCEMAGRFTREVGVRWLRVAGGVRGGGAKRARGFREENVHADGNAYPAQEPEGEALGHGRGRDRDPGYNFAGLISGSKKLPILWSISAREGTPIDGRRRGIGWLRWTVEADARPCTGRTGVYGVGLLEWQKCFVMATSDGYDGWRQVLMAFLIPRRGIRESVRQGLANVGAYFLAL